MAATSLIFSGFSTVSSESNQSMCVKSLGTRLKLSFLALTKLPSQTVCLTSALYFLAMSNTFWLIPLPFGELMSKKIPSTCLLTFLRQASNRGPSSFEPFTIIARATFTIQSSPNIYVRCVGISPYRNVYKI